MMWDGESWSDGTEPVKVTVRDAFRVIGEDRRGTIHFFKKMKIVTPGYGNSYYLTPGDLMVETMLGNIVVVAKHPESLGWTATWWD